MPNIDEFVTPQGNPNMMPQGEMPMAPAGPPAPITEGAGMAAADPGQEMITPEQRAELDRLFAQVQGANSGLVSKELMNRNQMSVMKRDLIGKMFEIMQEAGVDPTNPESIKAFLEDLAETDPDLMEMFETAFRGLTETDEAPMMPEEGMMEEPGMMEASQEPLTDRFQNLQRMGAEEAPLE